jgi:hypothetical protein
VPQIVHPQLGSNNQGTPTDFVTALYVAGSSLSIVGGSNFAPQAAGAKLLFLLNSVIGTSVISLSITYLMQIYAALRSRNSLCLKIHALSGETGDAADLLAHLFANNQLSAGYNNISSLALEVAEAKEAHHFYPILFYFRFPEPFYSVSRSWLIALDAVTLIRSALPKEADWLKQSGAVTQLWASALLLLSTLNKVFLQEMVSAQSHDTDRRLWQKRFENARQRLMEAGISVTDDLPQSCVSYMEQRGMRILSSARLAIPWLTSLQKSMPRYIEFSVASLRHDVIPVLELSGRLHFAAARPLRGERWSCIFPGGRCTAAINGDKHGPNDGAVNSTGLPRRASPRCRRKHTPQEKGRRAEVVGDLFPFWRQVCGSCPRQSYSAAVACAITFVNGRTKGCTVRVSTCVCA